MLNYDEILDAITQEEIKVYYSFSRNSDGNVIFNPSEVKFQDSNFKDNLYSDRLKLTLGPIIKGNQNKSFNFKKRFKNHSHYIDIRNNQNKYILNPKESITILTNERIVLNGDLSAIILPKVSLSEVGVNCTPAYIDPYYDGLLRLLITNTTDSSFEFKILDVIAQCYFFRLGSIVSKDFKNSFPRKSSFYGQNWNSIINEDRQPFPTKKNTAVTSFFGEFLRYKFENLWHFLKEYSLITSLITVFAVSLIGYGKFKIDYSYLKEKIEGTLASQKGLDTSILRINKQILIIEKIKNDFTSRKSEIEVKKHDNTGIKRISFNIPKEEIIAVLIPYRNINYKIYSGTNENECVIEFEYKSDEKVDKNTLINFEYVIIRQLK